jgi:hypothetical protein
MPCLMASLPSSRNTAEATATKDTAAVTSLDQYSRTSQRSDSSTVLSL